MYLIDFIDLYHNLSPNIKSSLVIILIIAIISIIVGIKVKKQDPNKPSKGVVLLFEILVDWINKMCGDNLGKVGRRYAPMILTFAMFIFLSNISGMFGLSSPTSNIMITVALGFISFFMIQGANIKYNGFKGYVKSFFEPSPVMFLINVISEVVTPFSLGMRLFGNILSGSIILILVYNALSLITIGGFPLGSILSIFVAPAFHAIFDVFFGAIQTYVFIFLTIIFIAGKLPEED